MDVQDTHKTNDTLVSVVEHAKSKQQSLEKERMLFFYLDQMRTLLTKKNF